MKLRDSLLWSFFFSHLGYLSFSLWEMTELWRLYLIIITNYLINVNLVIKELFINLSDKSF
jgi:hypothetical protein